MYRIKIYVMLGMFILGMFILGRGNIYGLGDNDLKQKNILTSKVLPVSAALGVGALIGGYYVYSKKTNDDLYNLNYEKFSYKSKESVNKIEIYEQFSDINILVEDVSNPVVNYYQNEKRKYEIYECNGVLKIKKLGPSSFINNEPIPPGSLKVIVPKNKIDLDVSSGFGNIFLNDLESSCMKVSVAFGNINLKNITSRNLEINNKFGDIDFERLNAENIKIKGSFGNTSGSLVGSAKDYAIDTNTIFGKCNLKNSSSGSRILNISSSFGGISISFDNKNLPW